jgi:hypothetical protein
MKNSLIKKGGAHLWNSCTRVNHVRTNFLLKVTYPKILHNKYMLILRMSTTLTSGFHNDYGTLAIKIWNLYNFSRHHSKGHACESWNNLSVATRKYFKFYQWSNNSYSQHLRWWVLEIPRLRSHPLWPNLSLAMILLSTLFRNPQLSKQPFLGDGWFLPNSNPMYLTHIFAIK